MADNHSIEKADRLAAIAAYDKKIEKHTKTVRVLVITEAIVCILAFGMGALSIFASLSGVADQAAADTGITTDMLGGTTPKSLLLFGGVFMVIMALTGFIAVILGKFTLDDPSYSASFTVVSFVTLSLSIVVLVVSIINGSFFANLSVIVINVFSSLSCVSAGRKMRGMYLDRKMLLS